MKKFLVISGLSGALTAGVSAPANAVQDRNFDSAVEITSSAPVPGGLTVGSWKISNPDHLVDVPAGTTYRIVFQEKNAVVGLGNGSTTVTALQGANVFKIAPNVYQFTLNKSISPGQSITGLWSMSQPFYTERATVSISLNSVPTADTDINSANDFATYTNGAEGF